MSEGKKYYWLKLKRDFFKRHDIKVIESMPNGEKYVLFYLKLLVESLDHSGSLRFSDTVPYNDAMLAAITGTDIDIVRTAVSVFSELGMMDKQDDGTLFMAQVIAMTGDETAWAGKKREHRNKKKEDIERTLSDKSIEYRVKSIELRDKNKENTDEQATYSFVAPTLSEVNEYVKEKGYIVNPVTFIDYYEALCWKDKDGHPVKNWKGKMVQWNARAVKEAPPAPHIDHLKTCQVCGSNYYGDNCRNPECQTIKDMDADSAEMLAKLHEYNKRLL